MSSVLTKLFDSSESGVREFINNPRIVKRSFAELLAIDSAFTKVEKVRQGIWTVKNYDNGNAIIIYFAGYPEFNQVDSVMRQFNDFESYMLSVTEITNFK